MWVKPIKVQVVNSRVVYLQWKFEPFFFFLFPGPEPVFSKLTPHTTRHPMLSHSSLLIVWTSEDLPGADCRELNSESVYL